MLEARPDGLEPEEAADELGALRRTVYRDLRVLEDAGVPLTSARDGRRARWRIMPGYRHRLQLSLTWSELVALMAARQALAGLAGTLFHDGAASALEKVRATLPRELAARFRAADGLVSTVEGGRDYSSRGEIVRRLAEAIAERLTVVARYRSRRGNARQGRRSLPDRRLDPLQLRMAEEGIYLIARAQPGGEVKSFLVDRFDAVRLTTDRFMLPPEGSAAEVVRSAFRMWSGRPRRVRFTVSAAVADLLMERKVHPSQVAQKRSDGSLEVELHVAVGPPLVSYLTGLAEAVREIEPLELREAVERGHRAALVAAQESGTRRDAGDG